MAVKRRLNQAWNVSLWLFFSSCVCIWRTFSSTRYCINVSPIDHWKIKNGSIYVLYWSNYTVSNKVLDHRQTSQEIQKGMGYHFLKNCSSKYKKKFYLFDTVRFMKVSSRPRISSCPCGGRTWRALPGSPALSSWQSWSRPRRRRRCRCWLMCTEMSSWLSTGFNRLLLN